LKFGGDRWVAEALGRAMVSTVDLPGIEAVSWVPTTSARRAKRGFDQAEVLANVVARALRLPRLALLKRTRGASGPQARRGGAERRIAMRGSFRLTGRPVPGTVLLVDDVFTTGATASECARTLREGGASRVGVITAARSLGAKVSTGPGTGLWLPGGSSSGSRCQPRAKRPT
jgi:ComF family protein